MRNFWISLNEKYQRSKTKLWFVVIAVVLFLMVMKGMDKMLKSSGGSSNETATSGSGYNEVEITENTIKEAIETCEDNYETIIETIGKEKISRGNLVVIFLELCNGKKYESAYSMLSEDCKKLLYPTKQKFIDTYCNSIFRAQKKYSIEAERGYTCKVNYKEDVISSGGNNASAVPEYITVTDDNKLNISNFIGIQDLKIKDSNAYFTAEITEKIVYADYEEYQIKIKNIIKADLYINQNSNNGAYIVNSSGNEFSLVSDEYTDEDYFVPAETSKSIKLKFHKNNNSSKSIEKMNLENIKIINKNYYDSKSKQLLETNYPEKASCVIKFEEQENTEE